MDPRQQEYLSYLKTAAKKRPDLSQLTQEQFTRLLQNEPSLSGINHGVDLSLGVGYLDPPKELLASFMQFVTNPKALGNYSLQGINLVKKKVVEFCNQEQISKTISAENILLGNGGSTLFDWVMKDCIKTEYDVVLMPGPGYGLFAPIVKTYKADPIFIPLNETTNWQLTPDLISQSIEQENERLFKEHKQSIIQTYQSLITHWQKHKIHIDKLPQILDQDLASRTTLIAKLNSINNYLQTNYNAIKTAANNGKGYVAIEVEHQKYIHFPSVRAIHIINPHNPIGNQFTQDEVDALVGVFKRYPQVLVIEDASFHGTNYGDNPIGLFTKHDDFRKQNRLFSLFTLSKIWHLPNVRSAFALTSPEIAARINAELNKHNYILSTLSCAPLVALCDMGNEGRARYLNECNATYKLHRDLMYVLLKGLHASPFENTQKDKIVTYLKKTMGKDYDATLLNGIPGMEIVCLPAGGFFLTLNLSGFIGKHLGQEKLNDTDLCLLLHAAGLDTIAGMYMGTQLPLIRVTFTVKPSLIVNGVKLLKSTLALLQDEPQLIIKSSKPLTVDPITSAVIRGQQFMDLYGLFPTPNYRIKTIDDEIENNAQQQYAKNYCSEEDLALNTENKLRLYNSKDNFIVSPASFCDSFKRVVLEYVSRPEVIIGNNKDLRVKLEIITLAMGENNPNALTKFFERTDHTHVVLIEIRNRFISLQEYFQNHPGQENNNCFRK